MNVKFETVMDIAKIHCFGTSAGFGFEDELCEKAIKVFDFKECAFPYVFNSKLATKLSDIGFDFLSKKEYEKMFKKLVNRINDAHFTNEEIEKIRNYFYEVDNEDVIERAEIAFDHLK